jgi:hypothetical protein
MRRTSAVAISAVAIPLALLARAAHAGEFDAQGEYRTSPEATFTLDFSSEPERFLPDDTDAPCQKAGYTLVTQDDALDSGSFLRLQVDQESDCLERLVVELPSVKGSYRATMWMRHGSLGAMMVASYPEGSGIASTMARFFPTGRSTSDGWIEMATNEFPVDGTAFDRAYLRLSDFASVAGVDIDALEIVEAGEFVAPSNCSGVSDPVCGDERLCMYEQCVLGRAFVPPLPDDSIRDAVIDVLQEKLLLFFGGRLSREQYLPDAMASLESMRTAPTAWAFWRAWSTGIDKLHDWHTADSSALGSAARARHRLHACFFEGDADRSHALWPKDPEYADVLVSHARPDAAGLKTGDRLVAIDGKHPIEWARSLVGVPGYHVATDPHSFADFPELLGGGGDGLLVRYATNFSVLRCDATTGTCNAAVETIAVADLPEGDNVQDLACDNRPFYHLEDAGESCPDGPCPLPNPSNHYVFDYFFRGRIAGTTPEEAIYGMVWDTLYGAGEANGWVNGNISMASAFWKSSARGVILDHRAGNGGTLDSAENMTKLVRPPQPMAVIRMPIEIAGDNGPKDAAEGIALFDAYKSQLGYNVGDADYDPLLPVALLLHRDGSASDYMPYGMKGAPKVRLFGPPNGTAGAFSTFIEFRYWGGIGFQIASGDTIGFDGSALIGHSVLPDEAVLPKQSDLLAGKDSIHEAALAWVRQELKP